MGLFNWSEYSEDQKGKPPKRHTPLLEATCGHFWDFPFHNFIRKSFPKEWPSIPEVYPSAARPSYLKTRRLVAK
jgi:hypothetical protein